MSKHPSIRHRPLVLGPSMILGLALLAVPAAAQTMQTTPNSPASSSISPSARAGIASSPGASGMPGGSGAAHGSSDPLTGPSKPGSVRVEGAQKAPIDINSASAEQLDALPGIGPSRAKAIVSGRPFRDKNELVSKHVLPQRVYDGIKDRIVARHG